MITPTDIAAATANPAAVDVSALERAFNAFALYPNGEGLSGFTGPDQMLTAFTDGVCFYLVGDFDAVPNDVHEVLRDHALRHGAPLLSATYRDGAAMAIANWHGFRERFAA